MPNPSSISNALNRGLVLPFFIALVGSASLADSIEQYWDPELGLPEADSAITALESNGRHLFAGGSFSRIGGIAAQGIAVWDGRRWTALGSGLNSNGASPVVLSILPHGGKVYVGVIFTRADSIEASRVVMWDGKQWHSIGEEFDGNVETLAWFKGSLYAGGVFSMSGDTLVTGLALWTGTEWIPVGTGVTRPREQPIPSVLFPIPGRDFETVETAVVRAIATDRRFLYVAGAFDEAGGVRANSIAAWDGSSWHALGKGLQQIKNGPGSFHIADIAVFEQKLYAGGIFRYAGDVAADGIAVWNGEAWSSVGELVASMHGPITKLVAHKNELYVAGRFGRIGMSETAPEFNLVAKWDGTQWSGLGTGPAKRSLLSLAVFQDLLWAGGHDASGPTPGTNNPAVFHLPGQLRIIRQDSELQLSWPRPDTELRLESTDDLHSGNWSAVEKEPQLSSHRWEVAESVAMEQKYFRLQQMPSTEDGQ